MLSDSGASQLEGSHRVEMLVTEPGGLITSSSRLCVYTPGVTVQCLLFTMSHLDQFNKQCIGFAVMVTGHTHFILLEIRYFQEVFISYPLN